MSSTIKLSSPDRREFWEVPVLFEDEHLLALDKPAGVLTLPDPESPEQPALMKLLHAGIAAAKPWSNERRLGFLGNAHRLDRDTTGVLLLAKSKAVLAKLAEMFGSEIPIREFVALVRGQPQQEQFEINAKVAPDSLKPGSMRVDRHGKQSHTHAEVAERFRDWTLLKCRAMTDRTHQIRVHLRHVRLRVAGDSLYDGPPLLLSRLKPEYRLKEGRTERPLISRAAVHLETLALPHPVTGERLTITAPLPKDFRVALKYLRQFAATPTSETNS